MARSTRDGGWRGAASRPIAMHRRRRRTDRVAATRQIGYQGGTVYDRTALQGATATPAAQRPGSRTPPLGELPRQLISEKIWVNQINIVSLHHEI